MRRSIITQARRLFKQHQVCSKICSSNTNRQLFHSTTLFNNESTSLDRVDPANPLQRRRQEKIDIFFQACETADLELLRNTIKSDLSLTEETILAKGKAYTKDYANVKSQPDITTNINALMYVSQLGYFELLQELLKVNGKKLIEKDFASRQKQGGFIALHSAIVAAGAYTDYLNSPNSPNLGVTTQDQELHTKRVQAQQSLPPNQSWLRCIQLLLEQGVDPNLPMGQSGFTPLMYAARHGLNHVVKLLLDYGADPNYVGEEGQTALNFAANYAKADTCMLLIGAGADPFLKDKSGDSFVSFASEERQPYNMQAIASFVSRVKDQKLSTEQIAQNRKIWFPDLTTSFKLEETDMFGNTALMAAAAVGNLEAVSRLIDQKQVNANAINVLGWTALIWSVVHGSNPDVLNNRRIVSKLISAGADPNLQTNDGLVPLCYTNNPQVMSDLIQNGKANVNIISGVDGSTPLIMLLTHARVNTDCVRLLINNSADVNTELADGTRPISFACLRGHSEAVELLIRSGAEYMNVIHKESGKNLMLIAASHGYFDIVRILIQNNMEVNFKSNHGAMHTMFYAVQFGHEQTIGLLLNLGVDINIKMHKLQLTPLHVAVAANQVGVVKLLLEYDADIYASDDAGVTPLQYAQERADKTPSPQATEILQLLNDKISEEEQKKREEEEMSKK